MCTLDISELKFWYPKSAASLYAVYPILGIMQTKATLWFGYGLEVVRCMVRQKILLDLKVRWPTIERI